MKNQFMTDEEYEQSFVNFWGLRKKVAALLSSYGLTAGVKILDVPAGHGFFALEFAKLIKKGTIVAIGLENDLEDFQRFVASQKSSETSEYIPLIHYQTMDATCLGFPSHNFDFVVNFLGLEDINMTKGLGGVKQAIKEFSRVLKTDGILLLTLCIEGEEPDQLLAKEVTSFIGHNAIFHPKQFYLELLEQHNIEILSEHWFFTHRKMTAKQAKEELIFACQETPKIFAHFRITTNSFDDLWKKYGKAIEKHGLAFYSQLCVLIGRKKG